MTGDLRVIRTKNSIRQAFIDMLCEMDYEKITVQELTKRAMINRKTFYLHYMSIDDLLLEFQTEMIENFIRRTKKMERPQDMDKVTREFFMTAEELGKLGEKLICSVSNKYISKKISDEIMKHTWKTPQQENKKYLQKVMMSFVSQSTLAIYRQWVSDGRKIPIDEIIDLATQLICNGTNSLCL